MLVSKRNLTKFVLISEVWHCIRERILLDSLWLQLIDLVGNTKGIVQYHRGRGQSHGQLEHTRSHAAEGHCVLELELHLQLLEKLVVVHGVKAFVDLLVTALKIRFLFKKCCKWLINGEIGI
jgi:hypothetical protein